MGLVLLPFMQKKLQLERQKGSPRVARCRGSRRTGPSCPPTTWMARAPREVAPPSPAPLAPQPGLLLPSSLCFMTCFMRESLTASTLPWEPAQHRLLAARSGIGNSKSGDDPGPSAGPGSGTAGPGGARGQPLSTVPPELRDPHGRELKGLSEPLRGLGTKLGLKEPTELGPTGPRPRSGT